MDEALYTEYIAVIPQAGTTTAALQNKYARLLGTKNILIRTDPLKVHILIGDIQSDRRTRLDELLQGASYQQDTFKPMTEERAAKTYRVFASDAPLSDDELPTLPAIVDEEKVAQSFDDLRMQ